MFDDYGVLYLCCDHKDHKYVDEAHRSANSVRRHMPQLRIGCVTDLNLSSDEFDVVVPLGDVSDDHIRFGRASGFLMKIKAMALSPFKKTLFLDADTYCCYPVWDIFSALLHSDLVAAHAPARTNLVWTSENQVLHQLKNRPYIPHLNAGMLAYRRCAETQTFFNVWEQLFKACYDPKIPNFGDQAVLQAAIAQTGLKSMFLPVEYNLRISRPATVLGPVRILHGRPKQHDFSRIERLFNFYLGERALFGMIGVIYLDDAGMVFLTDHGGKIVKRRFETYREFRRCLLDPLSHQA